MAEQRGTARQERSMPIWGGVFAAVAGMAMAHCVARMPRMMATCGGAPADEGSAEGDAEQHCAGCRPPAAEESAASST